jgi:hypothetical protein
MGSKASKSIKILLAYRIFVVLDLSPCKFGYNCQISSAPNSICREEELRSNVGASGYDGCMWTSIHIRTVSGIVPNG